MKRLQTLLLMLTFLTVFGCEGNGQTVKPDGKTDSKSTVEIGEQFTLKTDETAKVRDANIEITVTRIGRKWLADGGGESLDFSFSVKRGGKTERYSHPLPESITAGDFKIEVVKTEPFGYGYAVFVVTKKNSGKQSSVKKTDSMLEIAAEFIGQFGWRIDESIPAIKSLVEFPPNFNGLPFYHYQSASQKAGIDMTPLLSKKVEILKYTLRKKQKNRKEDFTSFAHLIIENSAVVGAWRTDSSASAPGIYSFVK